MIHTRSHSGTCGRFFLGLLQVLNEKNKFLNIKNLIVPSTPKKCIFYETKLLLVIFWVFSSFFIILNLLWLSGYQSRITKIMIIMKSQIYWSQSYNPDIINSTCLLSDDLNIKYTHLLYFWPIYSVLSWSSKMSKLSKNSVDQEFPKFLLLIDHEWVGHWKLPEDT